MWESASSVKPYILLDFIPLQERGIFQGDIQNEKNHPRNEVAATRDI
jgi:hypothetical protein